MGSLSGHYQPQPRHPEHVQDSNFPLGRSSVLMNDTRVTFPPSGKKDNGVTLSTVDDGATSP
eukprot:500276-Amphidinium_carterae.2